jgi:hypothetical protein
VMKTSPKVFGASLTWLADAAVVALRRKIRSGAGLP